MNNSPTTEYRDEGNASKSTGDIPNVSAPSEQDLKCYLCLEKFHKANFHSHMLKHSHEKKFSCAECKVKYLQQSKLNSHMLRTHTFEEKYIAKYVHKSSQRRKY